MREELGRLFVSIFVVLGFDRLPDEHPLEAKYPYGFLVAHGILTDARNGILAACCLQLAFQSLSSVLLYLVYEGLHAPRLGEVQRFPSALQPPVADELLQVLLCLIEVVLE